MFAESPDPINIILATNHAISVKGDSYPEIDPATTLEASELYPDVKYTSVDEYLNQFM